MNRGWVALTLAALALLAALIDWNPVPALVAQEKPAKTVLGTRGGRFTINGTETFLLGISYYGGLGAPEAILRADLDRIRKQGFNWLRVWATWAAFGDDVSAVTVNGEPRPAFMEALRRLLIETDLRGLIVDVTLSRGNGVTGPKRLQSLPAHERAVTALVKEFRSFRNWYLDLGNERNIQDARFVSFADLQTLRKLVKQLDPDRLVTASSAGDIPQQQLRAYLLEVGVDFLTPHRPRHSQSARETETKSSEYQRWMRDLGRTVPLHYQEPFRRGFGKYNPTVSDFGTDLEGARKGGAAGWCFHNGDDRAKKDGQPRRSFDLRRRSLFEQLDPVERAFLEKP